MTFEKEDYYKEKFSKIVLSGEIIEEKDFDECEFEGCSFVDCKFVKCSFINCKFSNCALSAVDPVDSRFMEISFSGSKVIGVDWTKAAFVRGLSFKKCQVNYSNFRMLKLQKMKMVGCEAKEVDFMESDLSEADFRGTDLERSVFSKTNLGGADFREARNYFIDAVGNKLKKAKFSLPEALGLLTGLGVEIVD